LFFIGAFKSAKFTIETILKEGLKLYFSTVESSGNRYSTSLQLTDSQEETSYGKSFHFKLRFCFSASVV
jgi:hypothetical protein